MKRLLLLVMVLIAANVFAQNPICVSVTDTPCDANWTVNSKTNTTGNILEDLYVYYDTGSSTNQVLWQIYLDTALIYEDSACGCGTWIYDTFFTDAAHELKVKIKSTACQVTNCSTVVSTIVKAFTPKQNTCYQDCD